MHFCLVDNVRVFYWFHIDIIAWYIICIVIKSKINMKKLNMNEWIGVGAGVMVVIFFLFGGTIVNLFNGTNDNQVANVNSGLQTGVEKQDLVPGIGAVAAVGDTVTVNYVGTLTSGKVFDSSIDRNQPFTFQLGVGQVIRGWDEGVVGMRVGGKRVLIIAPDFGYGGQTVGPIPANSILIFEVELLDVQSATN